MDNGNKRKTHKVSSLGKTWIFDFDGTVVKHNGHLTKDGDSLLPGAKDFFSSIPDSDMVIFITSRKKSIEGFLTDNTIPFDCVVYNAPYGERILVNDSKPSGLITAVAVNTNRDEFMTDVFQTDVSL